MMLESHNKGIIQRVIDKIYEKFSARQDLESNCQIKIAFIEIYKDSVTDLLEDHQQQYPQHKKAKNNLSRRHSASFVFANNNIGSAAADSTNRTKAKTFYGERELEDIVIKKRSKMEFESNRSLLQQ